MGGILEVGAAQNKEPRVREISAGRAWGWLVGTVWEIFVWTFLQSLPPLGRITLLTFVYETVSPGVREQPG